MMTQPSMSAGIGHGLEVEPEVAAIVRFAVKNLGYSRAFVDVHPSAPRIDLADAGKSDLVLDRSRGDQHPVIWNEGPLDPVIVDEC